MQEETYSQWETDYKYNGENTVNILYTIYMMFYLHESDICC